MAKESGLGDHLFIDGYDISGDIGSVQTIGAPFAALVMTDITQSAQERKAGLGDGALAFNSYFNPASARAFDVLSTLPRADRAGSYFHTFTLGAPAASLIAKQIGYDPNRGADGSLTLATSLTASKGSPLEWGRQHTPGKRTDTTATNGSSVDAGAASAFGLIAYLHLFAFTGTSVTVKIQSSSDNGVGDAWADVTGASFAAKSAIGWERIETAAGAAIERYLRVVTTGTFTNAVFGVNVIRNKSALVP